jgi:hypothetical protein
LHILNLSNDVNEISNVSITLVKFETVSLFEMRELHFLDGANICSSKFCTCYSFISSQILLTSKIGTEKGLTCGPRLVMKYHSVGKISSEDSVKMLAVGNTPSFGRRTVCAFKRSFRECVMTWPGYKEGTN